ncbi:hypothetical protein JG559_07270 [Enterococcus faecalis]|uniref:Uncharacterized protein n=1 Tax=Enterococcus faecalis TaxID=1351 RepID=A0A974NZA4_ENTFL|nr:hypothetical protein JG559_07270 [Enterococcus faecalis]
MLKTSGHLSQKNLDGAFALYRMVKTGGTRKCITRLACLNFYQEAKTKKITNY